MPCSPPGKSGRRQIRPRPGNHHTDGHLAGIQNDRRLFKILIPVKVDDPNSLLTSMCKGCDIVDETYLRADSFSRKRVHVLTSINYKK
jgi:hypothetical protein